MKNKLVMGIFSLLFGGLILISLIIPWWNESLDVFGLSGVFYPLSIPTLPKSDPVYLSYITGIYNATWYLNYNFFALFNTQGGNILLVKIVLVGAMILICMKIFRADSLG